MGGLPGGTLFTADGTQYGFSPDGYVNNIKDRNGNQVTLSFSSTYSGGIYSVTDPVGRVSTINFTESLGYNNQDLIGYPGARTPRNITVNYSLLAGANVLAPGQALQSQRDELDFRYMGQGGAVPRNWWRRQQLRL